MSSKRGNREGSIYRRSDGRWAAQISLPGDSRLRRRRKTLYGRTREQVRRKQVEADKALLDGIDVDVTQVTFYSFAQKWLQRKRIEVRLRTWEGYESRVRTHLVPAFSGMNLRAIKPDHLRDLYAVLIARGISARTVRHIHVILQSMLKAAEQDGLLVRNVARLVKPPRVIRREFLTLSPREARLLIDGAAGHPDEPLFLLAISTGLRIGELLGLRWEDVNLEKRTIRVVQSLTRHKGGWSLDETKTASSRRQIELTDRACKALTNHRKRQAELRLAAGLAWTDLDLVFASSVGTPRSSQNVTRRSFRPLLKRLELPPIRFQDLRHTAATLLLGEGTHPKVVSEMLGHASVQITLDTYSHVTPTMLRVAADAMESVLAG